MNLSCLLSLLKEVPAYRQLVGQLLSANDKHRIITLNTARPYLIAAIHQELSLPVIIITAHPEDAKKLYAQLQAWCPPSANLHRFAEFEFSPYEYFASYPANTMMERLQTLANLVSYKRTASCHSERSEEYHYAQDRPHQESRHPMAGMNPATTLNLPQNDKKVKRVGMTTNQPPLIVTSALAVIGKTISPGDFTSACHTLKQGMTADPLGLLRRWQDIGYEMEDMVEVPGTIGRRGGIIDIFPVCSHLPARIEFLGNQIESMRLFNPESQCSTSPISSLPITPAREAVISRIKQITSTLNLDSCTSEVKQRFEEDLVKLQQRQWFTGAEFYFPLFNDGNILDYLCDNAFIILDTPDEIKAAIERLNREAQESREAKMEHGELPQGFPSPYFIWEEIEPKINTRQNLILESWDTTGNNIQPIPFASPQNYGGKLDLVLKAAKQMVDEKQRLVIISHQANRLAELLQEKNILTSPASQIEQVPPHGSITLLQGSLDEGWILNKELALITDAEIFGFVKQRRPTRKAPVRRQWLLPQLSPGDYVVHVDHGIGRFNGLTKMLTEGTEQEYLVLQYAAGGKLYVPTDQIERVSRYIGSSDHPPALSRLGTQEWQRAKRRVEQSVADIAQELLALYAAREVTTGFAFSPDTLWQQELEASFPYMETADQAEAIAAVKEDMERIRPMDRLICGDVGYGKTEVALRAAFKVVMDNKQVAILVPTTVLAQQHSNVFNQRLQAFPLKVELLSRFCSPEKGIEILQGLANGTVDICIGTHRLLQKDIAFKNLGLVIIDEEQRFGVVQKEKLKQIRGEVDVLTLSATPIPRTLHMSLTGIRDMSIMETPPAERLSIKTYVGAYDDTLVRQAILREMERNGQVFFVHNRVQSIALVANKLQALIPEAKITIAHGQMLEEKLEKVIADFIAGKKDVLVATTIIQLGLDMPNVNTLIVDQSDKFGLTQLYQLRGRVGRGTNQAYAYFLFDKGKQLTPQAYKRLRTIFEATEMGAGFSIAMKDLEIRGAGNLLGVKQSGHIAAIGFALYCQMLAEAVDELKAKRTGERRPVTASVAKQPPSIALPLSAYMPEEYVPNLGTRLILYHRMARIENIEEVEDITKELKDRFGALPLPVENLLYMVKLKVLAAEAGISSISTQGRQIIIKPKKVERLSLDKDYNRAVKIGATQIRLDTRSLGNKWREVLQEILTKG